MCVRATRLAHGNVGPPHPTCCREGQPQPHRPFTSVSTETATALPLMAVRYEPNVDEYNRAPAGGKFQFPVWVEHQPSSTGAQVTELCLEGEPP